MIWGRLRPQDGHKRRKGRWARTTLQVASIDAAKIKGRRFGVAGCLPAVLSAVASAEEEALAKVGAPPRSVRTKFNPAE